MILISFSVDRVGGVSKLINVVVVVVVAEGNRHN